MPVEAASGRQQIKSCSSCGVDVSNQRRFRSSAGLYYCAACHAQVVGAAAAASLNGAQPASQPTAATAPSGPEVAQPDHVTSRSYGLIPNVSCPHCWHAFAPQDVMWVSAHTDLHGDPILGTEAASRFLPTRFTVDGMALDARGIPCAQLACPRCHLNLPRSVIETEPLFLSIIGGPKTGKSYMLASMTWELRKRMPSAFAVAFSDADPVGNQQLNDYEATLFLPDDPVHPVALIKTEESGQGYDQANLDGRVVTLPRPFLFNVRPTPQHIHSGQSDRVSRVLCLYDNAGESFQPGKDTAASPVTQHLAKSKLLMFLFDPTQDARFREKCRKISEDPQLFSARGTQRQETLLIEAAMRVRRHANLPPNKKYDRPLLILLPKSDVWASLIPDEDLISEPILPNAVAGTIAGVDVQRIERVSAKVRSLLLAETPELVAAAEDFCRHVVYIPVSALGHSPESRPLPDGTGNGLFIRPADISPHWSSVPILYMFARWTTGLIASNAERTDKR